MKSPTLEDAIALARTAHAGQFDKAGADYISHPLRVMEAVDGDDAKMVAVLHDVIEDTPVTVEKLREAGYPDHVIEAIEGVTKRPEEEGGDEAYQRFIERAAQNPLSRQVKIADLRDNMNLDRIESPTQKDHDRIERYRRALEFLEQPE